MSLKKTNKRKEKRYKIFKYKIFRDIVKNNRILFSTVQTDDIKMMLMSLDIYRKPKKSLKTLTKWFNKKTTLYGVSANSLEDMENLQSTEIYDFCERIAAEENIKIMYGFENHVETIPYGLNTSIKLSFNYLSNFMVCLNDFKTETNTEILSETFDF